MPDQAAAAPWPTFLNPMRGVLERAQLPEGAFDPGGEWIHRYSICMLAPERGAKGEHPHPYGNLVLTRKPAGPDRFTLDVDFSVATRGPSGMRLRAALTCAADRLATPQQWELYAAAVEKGQPMPGTAVTDTVALRDGVLARSGAAQRTIPVKPPFTTNWSLMEAVQRLPFGAPALEFEMLEDLDLRKPGQSLRSVADVSLPIGGHNVRLHGFRQIGRGILPMHYWLDDQHRLIAASGGLRAFIWEMRPAASRKEAA